MLWKKIDEQVYQFTSAITEAHGQACGYAVLADDKTYLIDPPADLTGEMLTQINIAMPSAILITHLQAEHIEGAHHFPQVPLHVAKDDAYLAQGEAVYAKIVEPWAEPWNWDTRGNFQGHVAGARNERPPCQPIALSTNLVAGETIGPFKILATAGHGKHALSLQWDRPNHPLNQRLIFCGDLIYGQGQMINWFDVDWTYALPIGYEALIESLVSVEIQNPDMLCPSHGSVISDPKNSLSLLQTRIKQILNPQGELVEGNESRINFPEKNSPAQGFRVITPHLHQWREGNLAVLFSETGNALLIDDGLCDWQPIAKRMAYHQEVIEQMKKSLHIRQIEIVIPTHYHGDHTECIPELVELQGTKVVCLKSMAGPIESPEKYNLACPLPWYGSRHQTVKVDRYMAEEQTLAWHEYKLTLFHLGGQTWYHAGICVEVDDQRVLFAGDACGNFSTKPNLPICYNDAEPFERGWASALDRIIKRNPNVLVCGHGFAVKKPLPMLHQMKQNWNAIKPIYQTINPHRNFNTFFNPFQPSS